MTLRAGALAAALSAILALALAGSASATVLCTDSECSTVYPTGTKIGGGLKSGTTARFTSGGSTLVTCTGSSIGGTTSNESGATVSGNISELTWNGCSQTTKTVANGALQIAWTSGSNGTVSGTGSEVTVAIFGMSCTYGTGGGTHLGTLTGGEEPTLAISATVPRIAGGFLCPASASWDAEYVITEPHALFVAEDIPKFRAESYPALAKGGPATVIAHTFFTGLRSITCNKATLTSAAFGTPVNGIAITPQYAECTSTGNLPATVTTSNCVYSVGANRKFAVENCANNKIEIFVYANAADHAAGTVQCKYKISDQAGLNKVAFVNEGAMAGRDIAFRFEVGGLAISKVIGAEMQCGESTNNGSYGGTTTMKALDSVTLAQVGWWRG